MRLARHSCAALLLSLLAACGTLAPPASGPGGPTQAQTARSYQDSIDLTGRLSVRYQGPTREEALHGNFNWTQTPERVSIALASPLGQTLALIEVTPSGALLTQAGHPPRAAPDADALTTATLGWPLPVAGLRDWLQGFAIGASGRRFIATPSNTTVTTRDGWHIVYAAWQDGDGMPQPKRIDLARLTEQAGEVSIRIVIDTWQAH
jgi:outer membrane lipoprotein LolB